jgi:hypothetical protein
MHACDLNSCTNLHCSRRMFTLVAPRSCAVTSSTNAFNGVGCHHAPLLPRSNPHSAPGTTACHFPRFRSLEAFVRRPLASVFAARLSSAGIRNPCMGRLLSRLIFNLLSPCSIRLVSIFSSRPNFDWPPRTVTVKGGRRPSRSDLPLTVTSTAAGLLGRASFLEPQFFLLS